MMTPRKPSTKTKKPRSNAQIIAQMHERYPDEAFIDVKELVPYDRNSRKHTEEEVDELIHMIREFGWTVPVLVEENDKLLGGHRRRLAAIKMNLTSIPFVRINGLSDEQKRAMVIADNKSTLNGEWDFQLLREELAELKDAGYDVSLTGFKEIEIESLFANEVDDLSKEWDGMPDFDQPDKMSYRQIVVHFDDDDAAEEFASMIGQKITLKTKFLWHPYRENLDTESKRYG